MTDPSATRRPTRARRVVLPRGLLPAALLLALAACAEREVILPGERLHARAVISPDGAPVLGDPVPTTMALSLPAVRGNADWTHRGGSAQHASGNQALAGAGTQRIWSNPVGAPSGLRHRVTADPIVAGGMVFTLDSRARASASAASGAGTVWSVDLAPPLETGDSASGGGLAYDAGRVFVTTGFGELVALDARSGGVLWRQRVGAPIGGAPTVADGVVHVTGRDATGWAVRAEDGKVLWQVSGVADVAGWMGASSPAAGAGQVVFPFASGQLLAVDAATGEQRWSATVGGRRVGRAITAIRDMTGDPVIAGDRVYAGTSVGRLAAFDAATGTEIWSARDGALSPPLVVGNAVFAVNDESQLVRLDAANGGRVWAVPMPQFTDARVRRQDRVVAHYGPVLANGRLYVASSDGVLRVFDPAAGTLIGQGAIPGGAATAPVVAGGTLYITGRDGQLHAFR